MTFPEALRAAMAERGVTVRATAAAVGISTESLSRLRYGHNNPSHDTALRLADFLLAGDLAVLSAAMHRGECRVCGRQFIARTDNNNRRYCSRRCLTTAQTRRARNSRGERLHIEARRWREATTAIAAFCRSCEWDGSCKTPTCELRDFSPLPLIQLSRRAA